MVKCSGTKLDGSQCTVSVNPPQTYCWWHDPANSERRRSAAARGGRGKANQETKELRALLVKLTKRVEAGELPTAVGAVCNQLITTRLKLIELERRVREADEFEERMSTLEKRLAERGSKGGY